MTPDLFDPSVDPVGRKEIRQAVEHHHPKINHPSH